MFQSEPSWLWNECSFGPSDYIGDTQKVFEKYQLPWECLECSQRFKWDMQLLRHERATGHQNPNREMRRQQKYLKALAKVFRCTLCSAQFSTSLERLDHRLWCPEDPRTEKKRAQYVSTSKEYAYQCRFHEGPLLFEDLSSLQAHIKTHKKMDQEKIEEIVNVFRQKKKRNCTGLTNEEYKGISQKFGLGLSLATIKRIFQRA